MSDEGPLLIRLSHSAAPGKSRDAKEVPVGREKRRRRPGGKRPLEFESPPEADDNTLPEEIRETERPGKVLDIII
jgi:hypothetical protein